jgi:hypothetical protein
VDTVRAYHLANGYLVEVDIVLPHDMMLKEAHDIGESLQHRLEAVEMVERAFVHLDWEHDHIPGSEHPASQIDDFASTSSVNDETEALIPLDAQWEKQNILIRK